MTTVTDKVRYVVWVVFILLVLIGTAALIAQIEPLDRECYEEKRIENIRNGLDFREAGWLARQDC